MAFKKYDKEQSYRDTRTGEIFTGKKITDNSFSRWKRDGRTGRGSDWSEFQNYNSIEDYENEYDMGFINPNSENLATFVKTDKVAPVAKSSKSNSKNNTMKNLNLEMGPASGQEFKLSFIGQVAIKTDEGFVAFDSEKEELTDVTGFTMDFEGAFYKMPTAKVEVGDLISQGGQYGYVTEVKKKKLSVLFVNTGEVKTIVPTKSPFGMNFYTKIVSMFDMVNGEGSKSNGLFGDMNPMMMMMMSGNGSSPFGGDMMNMMMMSQMMGGEGFGGMFGEMFGGKKKKKG